MFRRGSRREAVRIAQGEALGMHFSGMNPPRRGGSNPDEEQNRCSSNCPARLCAWAFSRRPREQLLCGDPGQIHRHAGLIEAEGEEVVEMPPLVQAPAARLEGSREGLRRLCLHKQPEMNRAGARLRAAAIRRL